MKRNKSDAVIFGVCSGIAQELGIDPILVRLAFVIASLMGLGTPALIYLILALLMPSN